MGAGGSISKNESTHNRANSAVKSKALEKNMREYPQFKVKIAESTKINEELSLSGDMYIRLAYESLDLLNLEQKLIIQFPYQSIISWGSSSTIFQISVFPPQVSYARDRETIKISFLTHEGKLIDARIMQMIRMLMADMDSCAISKEEFATLKKQLVQDSQLMEHWFQTIDQFSSVGRLFLAKQAMELMQMLEPYIPFERLDLACLLYERVINKESFQLVINLFESVEDRNNLVHRLHLKRTDTGFVTNCSLLQSTVESVGTLSPRAALSGRSVDSGSSLRVAEEVVSRVRVVTPSPHTSLDPIPTTAVITEVDSSGKYAAQSELNAVKEPSDPV